MKIKAQINNGKVVEVDTNEFLVSLAAFLSRYIGQELSVLETLVFLDELLKREFKADAA